MSRLTELELAAAVAFNRKQHHPRDFWMRVQTRVGAAADGVPGRETAARMATALARALGHDPIVNGRVKRGIGSGVFYVIFPGSGARRPLSAAEIQARGQAAFHAWGGHATLGRALEVAGGHDEP